MSDIEELLHDKYCAHYEKYNRPPDCFELSPDMFQWLMSEVDPYGTFTADEKGVHYFIGVRIRVNYN